MRGSYTTVQRRLVRIQGNHTTTQRMQARDIDMTTKSSYILQHIRAILPLVRTMLPDGWELEHGSAGD